VKTIREQRWMIEYIKRLFKRRAKHEEPQGPYVQLKEAPPFGSAVTFAYSESGRAAVYVDGEPVEFTEVNPRDADSEKSKMRKLKTINTFTWDEENPAPRDGRWHLVTDMEARHEWWKGPGAEEYVSVYHPRTLEYLGMAPGIPKNKPGEIVMMYKGTLYSFMRRKFMDTDEFNVISEKLDELIGDNDDICPREFVRLLNEVQAALEEDAQGDEDLWITW
jgi:hypothetical protein